MRIGSLPIPNFCLPDRGKSLPRLHKARIEARASRASRLGMTLKPGLPLTPKQPNPIVVGPTKPLQGPTPVRQTTGSLGQDTEARMGEASERQPFIDLGKESPTLTEADP